MWLNDVLKLAICYEKQDKTGYAYIKVAFYFIKPRL